MFFDVLKAFLCHYLFKVNSASDHFRNQFRRGIDFRVGRGGGRGRSGKKRVHSITLEIEKVLKGTSSNWKVGSSFKNEHFMGHGRLVSILGSYSIPVIDFSSLKHTCSGFVICICVQCVWLSMCVGRNKDKHRELMIPRPRRTIMVALDVSWAAPDFCFKNLNKFW